MTYIIPVTHNVSGIRSAFVHLLLENETYGNDGEMLELVGVSFLADEDHIFGKPNEDYIRRELDWYESMSLNVYDIPGGPPPIWRRVSVQEDGGLGELRRGSINSNYGFLLHHRENGNQYYNVRETLRRDPMSRQAIAIYTRPSMHVDATRAGMSDFVCTNTVQYQIRDGYICAVVNMRSNDAIFGYRNDYAWQRSVLERLASDLHVEAGAIIWQVGNLHVYHRHRHLIEEFIDTGNHSVEV